MNNSKTPKIVVGVGLAAVYAAGLGYFVLRGTHDSVPAQTVSAAPSTQIAAPVPPPAIVPASTDASTSASEPAAATIAAAAPVVKVPVNIAAPRPSLVESMKPKSKSNGQTFAGVAASPAAQRVIEESDKGSEEAAAVSETTNPTREAAEEVTPQVAAVAPADDTEVPAN